METQDGLRGGEAGSSRKWGRKRSCLPRGSGSSGPRHLAVPLGSPWAIVEKPFAESPSSWDNLGVSSVFP